MAKKSATMTDEEMNERQEKMSDASYDLFVALLGKKRLTVEERYFVNRMDDWFRALDVWAAEQPKGGK